MKYQSSIKFHTKELNKKMIHLLFKTLIENGYTVKTLTTPTITLKKDLSNVDEFRKDILISWK